MRREENRIVTLFVLYRNAEWRVSENLLKAIWAISFKSANRFNGLVLERLFRGQCRKEFGFGGHQGFVHLIEAVYGEEEFVNFIHFDGRAKNGLEIKGTHFAFAVKDI